MLYKGIYTNGHSRHRYAAEVQFLPSEISITYTDEQGSTQKISWLPAQLHPHYKSERHTHSFTYGEFPYQTLQVTHEQLPAELKRIYPTIALGSNKQYSFFSWNKPFLIGLLLTVSGLIALVWLVLLPWVARFALDHFPKTYEVQIGEEMYKASIEGQQLNEAAGKEATLFLKALIDSSEYPVKVDVVHSREVNAFALPGGHIIVYDGILNSMQSYEELAALLGHEYSHVKLRHSTRNILRQASISILLYTLMGDINGLSAYVLQNAASLNNLQYNRELEHEADVEGYNLMQQKQVDASGMLHLFETLKKSSDVEVPAFLSTHPATDERITFAKEKLGEQKNMRGNEILKHYFDQVKKQLTTN